MKNINNIYTKLMVIALPIFANIAYAESSTTFGTWWGKMSDNISTGGTVVLAFFAFVGLLLVGMGLMGFNKGPQQGRVHPAVSIVIGICLFGLTTVLLVGQSFINVDEKGNKGAATLKLDEKEETK